MPLMKIETNAEVPPEHRPGLLRQASRTVAEALGKPESYVMVTLQRNPDMLFSGEDAPLAYLELKSLGLPEERTTALSDSLCALLEDQLGIPSDRTYIEFSNPARHMWGWNSGTF